METTQRPWLVEDILQELDRLVIAAPTFEQSETLACDLLVSLATGTKFLDRFDVPEAVPAGYIADDTLVWRVHPECHRIAAARGLDWNSRQEPGSAFQALYMRSRTSDYFGGEVLEDVRQRRCKAVAVSRLCRSTGRPASDNSNGDESRRIDNLKELGLRTKAAILGVHALDPGYVSRTFVAGQRPPTFDAVQLRGRPNLRDWATAWLLLSDRYVVGREDDARAMWLTVGGTGRPDRHWHVEWFEGPAARVEVHPVAELAGGTSR